MKGLRINEAILKYNEDLKDGKEKMTQVRLAKIVMPDKKLNNAKLQINQLAQGHSDNVTLSVLTKLCEVLKVDYKFLIR